MVNIPKRKPKPIKKKLKKNSDDGKIPKLIYHYFLKILVFQYRVVDIPYFMDEMTDWEIIDYIDYIKYLDRNLWESSRLNTYMVAKANFRGIGKSTDVINLPWDKDDDDLEEIEQEHIKEISNEDIQRLKSLAKQFEGDF